MGLRVGACLQEARERKREKNDSSVEHAWLAAVQDRVMLLAMTHSVSAASDRQSTVK